MGVVVVGRGVVVGRPFVVTKTGETGVDGVAKKSNGPRVLATVLQVGIRRVTIGS